MQKHKANRLVSIFSIFLITLVTITACGTKKQTISQGKTISQSSISQLAVGMTKSQTRIVLGSPAIIDNFSENTWVYFYSKTEINSRDTENAGKLILTFEKDILRKISGGKGIVFKQEIDRGGSIITEPTVKKRGIFN